MRHFNLYLAYLWYSLTFFNSNQSIFCHRWAFSYYTILMCLWTERTQENKTQHTSSLCIFERSALVLTQNSTNRQKPTAWTNCTLVPCLCLCVVTMVVVVLGGLSLITHSFKPCVTTSNQKSQVSKTAVPLKSTWVRPQCPCWAAVDGGGPSEPISLLKLAQRSSGI